ncbi:hypothetical protein TrCOL_g5718, partial [Triparma columacea]
CSPAGCCSCKGIFLVCFEVHVCFNTTDECNSIGCPGRMSCPCCTFACIYPNYQLIDATANGCCVWTEVAFPPTKEKPLGCGTCFLNCAYDEGVKVGCFKSFEELINGNSVAPKEEEMDR